MESLGNYLKREREFRQIALIEVSEATRISSVTLNALEADQFDQLPGEAFVRGFLKAYAQHVGLDIADVLLRYDHLLNDDQGVSEEASEEASFPKRSWHWRWRYLWIATILSAIVVAAYFSSR